MSQRSHQGGAGARPLLGHPRGAGVQVASSTLRHLIRACLKFMVGTCGRPAWQALTRPQRKRDSRGPRAPISELLQSQPSACDAALFLFIMSRGQEG